VRRNLDAAVVSHANAGAGKRSADCRRIGLIGADDCGVAGEFRQRHR
jgi:hypothetical protein